MSPNLDDIVTFNATVKNIGLGYAIQPFYVRFYINYTYLGQTIVSHLSANESIIVIQTWTAAPDAGNITVVADYYDNIQEINESNNRRTELLPPVRLPDIVVSAITWTPTTFNESQMVNFSALIENTGAGNTTRYFEVTFYIDNTSIGSVGVNGIMAGNTTSVSRTWTATPGDHTIKVVADDLNQVPESNETNNDRIESLAMIEYADLTVSSITWTPATFCDGDIVNFTALVENVGAGNITKYFDVNFHINNTSIGSVGVNGLMAGDNVSVSKTWTAVPGNHTLKVVADDPNRVMESNETNNERSETLPGIEQPDLIVTNITWDPGSFEEGDSVIFNATIENNGTGNTSRNFYVGFKIDESYIGDVLVNGLSSGTSTSVIQTWSASVGDHNIVTWNPTTFCDGESVTFNATIKNNGTGNTSRTFYNTFYIDGSSIGSKLVNGLSAGSSVFVTLTWTATPGIHSIKVKADTNNAVSESNETNNEWNVTLPGIEYADFIVTNITWTPITFADGDTVTFNATSRNFYVSFKIDESYIEDVLVNGLSSGTSTSVTRTWSASVGDHNITVVADRYNSVFESNESNNTLTLPLGGVEYPDLIVSNITWNTTTFCDGESVTFNATIKNNGTGNTSRTFYNTFYIDESAIGGKWVNGLSASDCRFK
jgi:subtilase family serine protease